jgi:hypothetical protein
MRHVLVVLVTRRMRSRSITLFWLTYGAYIVRSSGHNSETSDAVPDEYVDDYVDIVSPPLSENGEETSKHIAGLRYLFLLEYIYMVQLCI